MIRELKGWHVATMFVIGFSIIIAVNLTLAFSAVSTFPGLEVKNSYVASQSFDSDRTAQEALGWEVEADASDGVVHLRIIDAAGAPVEVSELDAVLGRATHVQDDVRPDFVYDGQSYKAPATLGPGNWNIRLKAKAEDGTVFRQRVILIVRG
ncbi:MAG: FixH family protein [Pseudomonadota bacterium]